MTQETTVGCGRLNAPRGICRHCLRKRLQMQSQRIECGTGVHCGPTDCGKPVSQLTASPTAKLGMTTALVNVQLQ